MGSLPNLMSLFGDVIITEARVQGRANNQQIVNTVYYRTEIDVIEEVLGVDINKIAEATAEMVKQLFQANVLPTLHESYELLEVATKSYGFLEAELLNLSPLQEASYVLPVGNQFGGRTGSSNGPATCYNMRYLLAKGTILDQLVGPKRGYLALGPLADSDIGDDGTLKNGIDWLGGYQTKLDAAAADLSAVKALPGNPIINGVTNNQAYPVRVKKLRITSPFDTNLFSFGINGYSDVVTCTFDDVASFRRSRKPEA